MEARNVGERMNMSYEERMNSLASETEDVAREDQIFIEDVIQSASESEIRFLQDQEVNEKFNEMQREAVIYRGIVAPNLNNTSVEVVSVPRHNFVGSGKQAIEQAREWARNNLVGNHVAQITEQFEYVISSNAVGKFLSMSSIGKSDSVGVHLSILKELPSVINNSIEGEVHADYNKVNGVRNVDNGYADDSIVHRLYGAVDIDGNVYRVKTTITEPKNSMNRPHSYEVTQIELLDVPMAATNVDSQQVGDIPNNSISATNLLKDVEKSYDKGKKLLDESETITSDPTPEQLEQQRRRSIENTYNNTVGEELQSLACGDGKSRFN